MICEVYPILKLPRKCTVFDYAVPDNLKVSVGDLIRTPFKGRESWGIVRALKPTSEVKKLMELVNVVTPSYFTLADLERYETIARCLAQSVSSLLHAAWPDKYSTLLPATVTATSNAQITSADLVALDKCLVAIDQSQTACLSGGRDIGLALASVLRRKYSGQLLILLPTEREAELLARHVKLGPSVALLHGKTKPLMRGQIFNAWKTGQIKTLIGTRLAALMPAHDLKVALVLEAGSQEYLNERRNPRFDAREAVKLLAHQHQAKLVFFDPLPRLEDLQNHQLSTTLTERSPEMIINQASADELSPEPMLSDSVLFGIEKALQSQKKVLLCLNRKGVAKRLQCGKCGHIPTCGTCGHVPMVRHDDLVCPNCQTEMWIPERCPSCSQPKLALRGLGGTKVAENLQRLFPTATVGQIEKGKIEKPQADILLVTEYYFTSYLPVFAPKDFGLVADLAADIGLHASDFRGSEETARRLHRLIYLATQQGADILVQTWLPEILQPMLDLPQFVAAELTTRQTYQLPPAVSRYILLKTKLEDLPVELQSLAVERDDNLELPGSVQADLKSLPDHLKIKYEGAYV
ncbi:MAG: hypothetical protein WAZ14_03655 [Patescibacteria group bacterium]